MSNILSNVVEALSQSTGWDVVDTYNNIPSIRPVIGNWMNQTVSNLTNTLSEMAEGYSGANISLIAALTLGAVVHPAIGCVAAYRRLKAGRVSEAIEAGVVQLFVGVVHGGFAFYMIMTPDIAKGPNPLPEQDSNGIPAWRDFNGMCIPIGPECVSSNGTCMVTRV